MIYCENVVKILWTWQLFFFLLFHRFCNFFFPPFLTMPLPQLLKKNLYPYFGNGIATIYLSIFLCFIFSFSLRALHARAAELGRGNSVSPLPKFNIFSLHLFSSSLSYFWFNFGNGNTEIQSLSSKSQITLNSTYNAN